MYCRGWSRVRRYKGVVNVGVEALVQLGHERGVVALLARVEPQVLQQLHARRQLRQARSDGRHRVLGVGLPLGPSEGGRSEERRGGKECVSTWRYRWAQDN